jgi:hypothetical protein
MSQGPVYKSPHAQEIPFNNSTNGFISDLVQPAIEEIASGGGTGASPGFQFTRSGNIGTGAYLQVGSVPSNLTGSPIGLTSPKLVALVISNEIANTFNIQLEEHDGTTYTTIGTYSVVASRSAVYTGLSVNLTSGKELAVKVSSGSAKNLVVNVYVKGNSL